MKRCFVILLFAICVQSCLFAQSIRPYEIEDSVFGWMKVYHFKGAKESKKVDAKVYSIAQLSICDSFANWIQASYTPKGALGDIRRSVSEKLGPYNQYKASLPPEYGAYAKIYVFLRYNSKKKIEPETDHHLYWGIFANGVPGWEIRDLSTATEYYFTMPSFEESHDGGGSVKKIHDMTDIPILKPYTTFWIKDVEAGNGSDYVLMSKDNKSPFIKLTKGEYLELMERAIPRFYEKEKKEIYEQNKGDQRDIDYFMKALEEKKLRFTTTLKGNKEKYKDRLSEVALTSAQPTMYDLETGRDVFSNGYLTDVGVTEKRFPVYKIDPVMAELCKKDKPQWILMSWYWTPNDPVEKHLHESIINNFNFEYVYNFFFDPEKVKGQAYKPRRSPTYQEQVLAVTASESSKKMSTDKNVFFFEDFSTTPIGKKPVGWQAKLAQDGSTSVVTKLDGLDGNWAVIGADCKLLPNQIKKPLPQNFTLSYDLVAAKDFSWGAKGLSFKLSKETSPGNAESFIELRLRPGFDGRDGETTIETKFPSPPGYLNGTKWYGAPGFSNNKVNNHILVTIKKKDELLQFFIDGKKIAEYEKAIPAAHLFNSMSFYMGSANSEKDRYYISNIKITNE